MKTSARDERNHFGYTLFHRPHGRFHVLDQIPFLAFRQSGSVFVSRIGITGNWSSFLIMNAKLKTDLRLGFVLLTDFYGIEFPDGRMTPTALRYSATRRSGD